MAHGEIKLSREVDAVRIPSGEAVKIGEGVEVMITQSLGGSYTVVYAEGMARIDAKDGDALGMEEQVDKDESKDAGAGGGTLEEQVWIQLKKVYDPEIPVNIVDLGLVYEVELSEVDGGKRVDVKMTLTAPGCGMGPTIQADAQGKVMSVDGVKEAEVDLVWEPAWNQDMITEEGKMRLGMV